MGKDDEELMAETVRHVPEGRQPEDSGQERPEARKRARRAELGPKPNNVRKFRMERMMSKAELARRAGISPLTVDRVERGMNCRMDTKRKILEALGLKPSDRKLVFPEDD